MDGITEIHIENRSRWTISECVRQVAHLMDVEGRYIAASRDRGCTFRFAQGVSVSVFPICPAYPVDTLSFYIFDAENKKNRRIGK